MKSKQQVGKGSHDKRKRALERQDRRDGDQRPLGVGVCAVGMCVAMLFSRLSSSGGRHAGVLLANPGCCHKLCAVLWNSTPHSCCWQQHPTSCLTSSTACPTTTTAHPLAGCFQACFLPGGPVAVQGDPGPVVEAINGLRQYGGFDLVRCRCHRLGLGRTWGCGEGDACASALHCMMLHDAAAAAAGSSSSIIVVSQQLQQQGAPLAASETGPSQPHLRFPNQHLSGKPCRSTQLAL